MRWSLMWSVVLAGLVAFAGPPVEAGYHGENPCAAKNPCAANPCAAKNPCAGKAVNPCTANPCAANPCNPCAAKGAARGPVTVRTVWGEVVSASPQTLVVKAEGSSLDLQLTKQTEIKIAGQGLEKKSVDDLRPGTRVAVSFLEDKGSRRATYVYLARAAANPCAANPCGAKNPCAANPCAANPCAAKNPCNPCGARK